MPQTNDSVLVSASRDGQVRRHVISGSGELVATDKVAYHSDSAHKVIWGNFVSICCVGSHFTKF